MALTRRFAIWLMMGLLLYLPASAGADEADLKQAIADLGSQTSDKERMDGKGAAKIEINQIRTWLDEASNAVKEENAELCRRRLTRVRAQLILVDHLVTLSQLQAKVDQVESEERAVKAEISRARTELEQKEAKVRALKITQESK